MRRTFYIEVSASTRTTTWCVPSRSRSETAEGGDSTDAEGAAGIPQPKRARAASMSSAMTRTMRSLVKFFLIGKPSRSIAAITLFGEQAVHPPGEVS